MPIMKSIALVFVFLEYSTWAFQVYSEVKAQEVDGARGVGI